MTTLSEKLGLTLAEDVARKTHNAIRNTGFTSTGEALVEADRRATLEKSAEWLEGPESEREIGEIGSIVAEHIRQRLLKGGGDG